MVSIKQTRGKVKKGINPATRVYTRWEANESKQHGWLAPLGDNPARSVSSPAVMHWQWGPLTAALMFICSNTLRTTWWSPNQRIYHFKLFEYNAIIAEWQLWQILDTVLWGNGKKRKKRILESPAAKLPLPPAVRSALRKKPCKMEYRWRLLCISQPLWQYTG